MSNFERRFEKGAGWHRISSMKSVAYPLQAPTELMDEVGAAAKSLNLRRADVLRQSTKVGLLKAQGAVVAPHWARNQRGAASRKGESD